MEEHQLITPDKSKYVVPIFSSDVKFTPVMEEVLLTLLTFYVLSEKNQFSDIITPLTKLLGHTEKTIRTTLCKLSTLSLLTYSKNGKYRTVSLHLDNHFIRSLLVRFFGISLFTSVDCERLKRKLNGFFPIGDLDKTIHLLNKETARIDTLLEEDRDIFDWLEQVTDLDHIAQNTVSLEQTVDGNPLLIFIDTLFCNIGNQQDLQSYQLGAKQLDEIIAKLVDDNEMIPPWIDYKPKYRPLADVEEDLLK